MVMWDWDKWHTHIIVVAFDVPIRATCWACMKDHKHPKRVFDPKYLHVTDGHMPVKEREIYWPKSINELFPNAVEGLFLNAPKLIGCAVQISCFLNTDYGGDQITWISRAIILVFLNKPPIVWYPKRQNTVETSTFSHRLQQWSRLWKCSRVWNISSGCLELKWWKMRFKILAAMIP